MRMKRSYVLLAAAFLFFYSCSKNNEEDLSPNPPPTTGGTACDTVNMKFATNIKPILETACYACHSNANFSVSGVKLEDYSDVKRNADNGKLLGTITHAAGYPPMPQGGAKLSDCNINKVRAWINRGTQNN